MADIGVAAEAWGALGLQLAASRARSGVAAITGTGHHSDGRRPRSPAAADAGEAGNWRERAVSITEEAIQLQNEVPTQIGRLPHMPMSGRSWSVCAWADRG